MKITVLVPKNEFSKEQQECLGRLGKIVFVKSRKEHPLGKLADLAKGSQILAADPDVLGGFEKAKLRLTELMEGLPNLKSVALASSSFEWIDVDYCRKRSLTVTNVPHYSTESVAEHALGLMICLAKNIVVNDRKFWLGRESKFGSGPGFELRGKTLGVIGLGSIGSRIAELGQAIGMKVIAYNRTPKKQKGVEMKSLNQVLSQSDVLSVNLACNRQTYHFISKQEIKKMKEGVVIVNLIGPVTPDREVVDKKAMAQALREGKVFAYAYEAEDLVNNPLSNIENAIGLKGFAWYTKEALERAKEIWTDSIISFAQGRPINVVK
jgi:lactate dehydrogenase-like 2-hydroxyacid dehydrogenase